MRSLNGLQSDEFWKVAHNCLKPKYENTIELVNVEHVIKKLLTEIHIALDKEDMFKQIPEIIAHSVITYEAGFDKICFVVDRDRESFLAEPGNNQYEYVLDKCQKNGFGFYISNPCFEFWLLLHFDAVKSLEANKLLENVAVSNSKRYVEAELCKVLPRYKKTQYDTSVLMSKINDAIANEALYCEDARELESRLGSRVGLLIKELRAPI